MSNYKNLRAGLKAKQAMVEHYQELFTTAVRELHYERLNKEHLTTIICEVETLLNKEVPAKLIKQVIKNGMERSVIDQSIHNSFIGR